MMALFPDGQAAIVGSQVTLCAYRVADGSELWCRTPGEAPMSNFSGLAVSPDGKTFVTGMSNGLIVLWDSATGTQKATIQNDTYLHAMAWSPDSQKFAAVLDSGYLMVWDAGDGSQVAKIDTDSDSPNVIQWSPDGKSIAGGTGYTREVSVWNVQTGKITSIAHFFPEMNWVSSLTWSQDSSLILAGSSWVSCYENCTATFGGMMVLFDAHSGEPKWQIDAGNQVHSLALSPDGTQVLAWVGFDSFKLYHMSDGSLSRSFPANGLVGAFWLPDGKRLLSLDGGDNLALWDLAGAALSSVHLDGYYNFANLAWSPDGSELAASQWNGPVAIWDRASGKLVRTVGTADAAGVDGNTAPMGEDGPVVDSQTGPDAGGDGSMPEKSDAKGAETGNPVDSRGNGDVNGDSVSASDTGGSAIDGSASSPDTALAAAEGAAGATSAGKGSGCSCAMAGTEHASALAPFLALAALLLTHRVRRRRVT